MIKQYRFLDEFGCMLQQNSSYTCVECGKGDALWRTSLAHIAYPFHQDILRGVTSCFTKISETNGIRRHPTDRSKTTSRDQLIMLLAAAKLTGMINVKAIAEKLPRQISDKYKWTPDGWQWVKTLAEKNRYAKYLFPIMVLPNCFGQWLNFPLKWLGVKNGKAYPHHFTAHLTAWMLYTTPKSIFRKFACRILLVGIPKSNTLVRKLLGSRKFDKFPVARHGWQWQRLPWVNYHGIDTSPINPEDQDYLLDTDILHIFEK